MPVRLVDRSGQGRLALTGPEAAACLHGLVTNDVEGLTAGTGCYAAALTHKGKMVGDLRVLHLGDELHLDTERVGLQAVFNVIRRGMVGRDVELHKRTVQEAQFSLLGDGAVALAGAVAGPEHTCGRGTLGGAAVIWCVTDLGADVFCAAEDGDAVREALLAAGALAVDEAEAEVARVESGRPRYGIDLDESVIPQEAGLNERAVSFTKGCYTGQETVARLFYKGKPNRHLRGLRLSGPVAPGTPLVLGEREVGRVGSVVESARFGPIALAIVRREAAPGDTVVAGDVAAEVVELPFS